MTGFLRRLADELKGREQYLEDKLEHPAVSDNKADYDNLKTEVKELSDRVEKAIEAGEDYDESLSKTIEDDHQTISVKIEAWSKHLD